MACVILLQKYFYLRCIEIQEIFHDNIIIDYENLSIEIIDIEDKKARNTCNLSVSNANLCFLKNIEFLTEHAKTIEKRNLSIFNTLATVDENFEDYRERVFG